MTEPAELTKEELIERHKMLHRCLDELVACWIGTGPRVGTEGFRLPSGASILDLIRWSYEQTKEPACFKEGGIAMEHM